jgi:hypothetical protein
LNDKKIVVDYHEYFVIAIKKKFERKDSYTIFSTRESAVAAKLSKIQIEVEFHLRQKF